MTTLLATLSCLMFLTLCLQGYRFAVTRSGVARQQACQHQGIFFTTLGCGTFAVPVPALVFSGAVLIMVGLRLIAHGLDRLDKSVYIDRYQEETPLAELRR